MMNIWEYSSGLRRHNIFSTIVHVGNANAEPFVRRETITLINYALLAIVH